MTRLFLFPDVIAGNKKWGLIPKSACSTNTPQVRWYLIFNDPYSGISDAPNTGIMKRLITTLIPLMSIAFMMMGADRKPEKEVVVIKKHCTGYTIVEAGLGVDCHGDTVKLVKTHGFYEIAQR